MIIRSLARRPSAIQCVAAAARRASPTTSFARSIGDKRPTLEREPALIEHGVPGLLSKKAFDQAWIQYQQHMVDEVNAEVGGTNREHTDLKSLVVDFARDPNHAYKFNVASMAWNNHFFFSGINTDPEAVSQPSSDLLRELNKNFISLDTLRTEFLATADAMFGPGYVWLVQLNDVSGKPMRIMSTYLAGTPISGAHYRKQPVDLNVHNPDSIQNLNTATAEPINTVGAFGSNAAKQKVKPKLPLGGTDIVPLLCVNTWQHVWLHDYGITGKRAYLEKWWDKINWEKVRQYTNISSQANARYNESQFQKF